MNSGGMQPKHGHGGQMHACWNHYMTKKEFDTIRLSGFPIAVIHGRLPSLSLFVCVCGHSEQKMLTSSYFFF